MTISPLLSVQNNSFAIVLLGYALTLIAYMIAKRLNRKWQQIPVIVWAMMILIALLKMINWHYDDYMAHVQPLFDHLLGYVTVALAIPLAAMRFDDVPLKPMANLLIFASISAVVMPISLAYLLHLSHPMVMAFATRAVTTPVALNIATILHAPLALVSLIVILSGVIGAACSPIILKRLHDERAAGLALGLAAHAIGTIQAWQRSPTAGRYAAFGMAVNALITAIWLPLVFQFFR